MRRCSLRSSLAISISSPQSIVGQPVTVFPCGPAGGSPLLPYLPSLHRSFTQVSASTPYFSPLLQVTIKSRPGSRLFWVRAKPLLQVPSSAPAPAWEATWSERLGNQTKVLASSWACWSLRGAVGSVWSAGGYLGNTSAEFLNLSALLFRSNYILMLLLSWKLEQSLTSTWSIMYKLVALGKILHILSITVGCWWAHAAGPGLIITCPEGLRLRQEAP